MLVTRHLSPDIDLLALHRLAPHRYPLLLESSASGTAQGRWDLLLATNGESIASGGDGLTRRADGSVVDGDFLSALDHAWHAQRTLRDEPRWPFRGGWALFLGYELAEQIEPVLELPRAQGGLPVALALRCPAAVLRDHATGECVAVVESAHAPMLPGIVGDIESASEIPLLSPWHPPVELAEDDPGAFIAGVARILDYLVAGDAFQVNLSRGWSARFDEALDPAALFSRLRSHNPAPFAGLFAGHGWAVVSASPERLVSVRGDVIETRPIAGTRPRRPRRLARLPVRHAPLYGTGFNQSLAAFATPC